MSKAAADLMENAPAGPRVFGREHAKRKLEECYQKNKERQGELI